MKEGLGINFCKISKQRFLFPERLNFKVGTKFYSCLKLLALAEYAIFDPGSGQVFVIRRNL
jgi:hypothetical protein